MTLAAALQEAASSMDALGGGVGDYLKLLITLALVAGLAFVVLRYWLPALSGVRQGNSGPIQIAARLAIEPRKNLYIIKAGPEYVLVGASEAGLQFLTVLDAAALEPALTTPAPPRPEFARLVRTFARRRGSPETERKR